jgi:hypothetical protein
MPIAVKCGGCGHEMTVADTMSGKKGRCPECDAVLSIPDSARRSSRRRDSGSDAASSDPSYGKLSILAGSMAILGLLLLLGFAGVGVYTGVVAVRFPEDFVCPFGVFDCLAGAVAAQPILVGLAFGVGGILMGAFCFLVFNAVGQSFLVMMSIEKSLRSIAGGLAERSD